MERDHLYHELEVHSVQVETVPPIPVEVCHLSILDDTLLMYLVSLRVYKEMLPLQ